MCKSFHKMAQGVTAGCLVQRNPGVKPARSTAVRVTEFTPELAPFPLKTRRVPDRLSSFLTLQDWGDLLPQYTAHINISSTCHHPGLRWVGGWGSLKELRSAFLKIYPLHFFTHEQTSPMLMMGFLYLCHQNVAPNTPLVLSWSTFTVRCDCLS